MWNEGTGTESTPLQQPHDQQPSTDSTVVTAGDEHMDEEEGTEAHTLEGAQPPNDKDIETTASEGGGKQSSEKDVKSLYYNICPPQSAGEVVASGSAGDVSNTVFVVNGLSSLGARVARALGGDTQWEVLSITSTRERSCGDELMWYRQDMLRESGVPNVFIDWSDSNAVGMILKARQPSHVIIIPPSVDGKSGAPGHAPQQSTMWADALHDFVALLEAVKNIAPALRLTLVSVSKSVNNELELVAPSGEHISILETLVGAFELSLSTYHTLYQIPFSVLRMNGFYGPWTHDGLNLTPSSRVNNPAGCYIDDIVRIVVSSLSLSSKCTVLDFDSCKPNSDNYALEKLGVVQLTASDEGKRLTKEWRNMYHRRSSSKLILTSYFTGNGFHFRANRFEKLQSWLDSVSSHRLDAVVLHNGLDDGFIARSKQHYFQLHFELISLPDDFGQNSTCLQSVRAFANYLEYHKEIEFVVIMDPNRTIKRNVFPMMEVLGDWLYSDVDVISFRDILSTQDLSAAPAGLASSVVLGGTRHMVLATLNKMAVCLENGQLQATSALQCAMDRQFVQHAFLGWPFSVAIR
jgi:citrate lyase gamma subunit